MGYFYNKYFCPELPKIAQPGHTVLRALESEREREYFRDWESEKERFTKYSLLQSSCKGPKGPKALHVVSSKPSGKRGLVQKISGIAPTNRDTKRTDWW